MKQLLCILSIFISISVEAQVTFERTYGGIGTDLGNAIAGTADGGYLIVGSTNSFGVGLYAIRVDSVGDTLWTKIYQGSGSANGYSVDTTANGFIIAGSTNSFGAGGNDILLIRIDSSGDTLWTRTYGGSNGEGGTDVIANSEGGYTVAGSTSSFGAGSSDAVVIKTDANGDTLWTRTYGLSQSEGVRAIAQTSDSGYVMVGTTTSFSNGLDMFIIRINSAGDTLWTKAFEGSTLDEANDIIQTLDGGYAVCGYGDFSGNYRMVLIKLGQNGSVQWQKSYLHGTLTWGKDIHQLPDGSFVIGGVANSGADLFILKVNQFGSILWSNGFSYLGAQGLTGMVPAKDGGFCMVGGGVYLVKVDSLGQGGCNSVTTSVNFLSPGFIVSSGCLVGSGLQMSYAPLNVLSTSTIVGNPCSSGIEDLPNFTQPTVYPNPTEGKFEVSGLEFEVGEVLVFGLLGNLLLHTESRKINLSSYPAGIYFVRVGKYAQKLILSR